MPAPANQPAPIRKSPVAAGGRRREEGRGEPLGLPDMEPAQLAAIRELFWHNVVREMFSGLMAVAEKRPDLMDGRFAVLTRGGERVGIARVEPVFAYTVRGSSVERQTSTAVQLTVFRVVTPEGEVFTLPIQEVRGFHELTPELLARLQEAEDERRVSEGETEPRPFGFAAFQALPKIAVPLSPLPPPAPDEPLE